jgi:hypothetical protein
MRKLLGFVIVLGLAATPSLAQKVIIDYAHDYDWDSVKTYQYVETKETDSSDTLMADRITSMIRKELEEGRLQEVEENPDIFITYHITTEDYQVLNTSSFGYGGYGGGWGGWGYGGGYGGVGMASSTTTVSNYTEGTLIIDAYDSKEKKMIWRGSGTVTIKAKPEKQIKQVDKILTKMGARWDKILRGMGK